MLRQYERAGKINPAQIDRYAESSDVSDLENIILDCLNDNIIRLKKNLTREDGKKLVVPLREASVIYGYSQDYLRNLINRKKIDAIKRGKLWYVKIQEIEKYISQS